MSRLIGLTPPKWLADLLQPVLEKYEYYDNAYGDGRSKVQATCVFAYLFVYLFVCLCVRACVCVCVCARGCYMRVSYTGIAATSMTMRGLFI